MAEPRLSIRRDSVDVTVGGFFGHQPDAHRVYLPGLTHYYVDDRKVPEAEFMKHARRALARMKKKQAKGKG